MTKTLKILLILLSSWGLISGCTSDEKPPERKVKAASDKEEETDGKDEDLDDSADPEFSETCDAALRLDEGGGEDKKDGDEIDMSEDEEKKELGDCFDKEISSIVDDGASTIQIKKVPALSTEEALKWLKKNCSACHDSVDGSVKSFWSMDVENLSKEWLNNDPLASTAYYSLVGRGSRILLLLRQAAKPH